MEEPLHDLGVAKNFLSGTQKEITYKEKNVKLSFIKIKNCVKSTLKRIKAQYVEWENVFACARSLYVYIHIYVIYSIIV